MAGLMIAVLALLAAVAPAYGTDYIVGDSSGWSSGVDYATWAKGKTFNVGDSLVFQYSAMHNVAEVSSADYSACSAGNSLQSYSDQNTKIALTAAGTRYFICGTPGHCSGGMKLAVTVAAATPASSPPSAPSATPAAPGTETPPDETTPSASTPATTTTAPTTKSTPDSIGGASGGRASRLVTGLSAGAVGLVGLALIG